MKNRFYFSNDYKKHVLGIRNFELIPTISICFHNNWKFESIRIYWLGFILGFSFD